MAKKCYILNTVVRHDSILYTTKKHNGTAYCEIREYSGYSKRYVVPKREKNIADKWEDTVLVRFAFITKVWNDKNEQTKKILDLLTEGMEF